MYCAAVAALAVLFTFLDPDSSRGTSVPVRFLFWFLHAGLGIAVAVGVARLLSRAARLSALAPWVQVSLAGLIALPLFVPASLGIEASLLLTDEAASPGESATGAFLAELLEAGPIFLPTWCLLNLSPLISASAYLDRPGPAAAGQAGVAAEFSGAAPEPGRQPDATSAAPPVPRVAPGVQEVGGAPVRVAWLDRLPPAVGRDIVSISADLHYLNVVTTRGRALVLGNLRDAAVELDAAGVQVHRSHWVAVAHVRRVVRTARGWTCVLSDARVLPVSRRRVEAVKTRLGTGFLTEG